MREITPLEASQLLGSSPGAVFVDVRSRSEYESGHPAGAAFLPYAEVDGTGMMAPLPAFGASFAARFPDKNALILLTCQSGNRSRRGGLVLESLGYTNIINVDGGWGGRPGITGWRDAGLPTARGAE